MRKGVTRKKRRTLISMVGEIALPSEKALSLRLLPFLIGVVGK